MLSESFSNFIITNNDFSNNALLDLKSKFCETCVNNIFIFTVDTSPVNTPFCIDSQRIQFAKNVVNNLESNNISVKVIFNILADAHVFQFYRLNKYCTLKSKYLFITLPIKGADSWFDTNINYLLYHQKLKPVFLSFDKMIITYPESFINNILRISDAIFSIDLASINNIRIMMVLKRMLLIGVNVIFEISENINNYSGLENIIKSYKGILSYNDYTKLILNISKTAKLLF